MTNASSFAPMSSIELLRPSRRMLSYSVSGPSLRNNWWGARSPVAGRRLNGVGTRAVM